MPQLMGMMRPPLPGSPPPPPVTPPPPAPGMNAVPKHWTVQPSFDGMGWLAFPNGDKPAPTPIVLYTDAATGPTGTGKGENGLGCYLSIYGFFGGLTSGLGTTIKVYIGGVEVANYRNIGNAVVGFQNGIQRIDVQVGNLGGAAVGTALPVQVKIAGTGSNTNNMFTPTAGDVHFASLSGNNATAVANDITHPWRSLQCWDGAAIYSGTQGGISNIIAAGDHVVVLGGSWSDTANLTGFGNTWFRCRYPNHQGTATANIHFTSHPGAIGANSPMTATYTAPGGTNPNNGGGYSAAFAGANSAYIGTTGDFITVSNFHLAVSAAAQSDAAPVNSQYSVQGWRSINNELGPWPSNIEALAAGISGHAFDLADGNYIHDFNSSTGLELHGIYMDSAETTAPPTASKIMFNVIKNMMGGNMIQLFDNVGNRGAGWPGYVGLVIAFNYCENSGKYGLNLADGTLGVDCYNNIIKGSTYSPCRLELAYPTGNYNVNVVNNTFHDFDQVFSGSGNAVFLNDAATNPIGGTIRVYSNVALPGTHTIAGESTMTTSLPSSYFDVEQNIWYGPAQGWSTGSATLDALGIYINPGLVNPAGGDFTPTAGGAALNAVTVTPPISMPFDYFYTARPQGSANDIGAVEKIGG